MKRLKTIFACMLMALFSIGQVWATTTYTKVTSVSSLSDGDKVVIAQGSTAPTVGVKGGTVQSSTTTKKDAVVSSTESEWLQFTVTTTTDGWYLSDGTNWIGNPAANTFYLTTSTSCKGVCSVDENGVLVSNSRYLVQNSTYYRMYTSVGSNTPFYVWKVTTSGGSTPTLSVDPTVIDFGTVEQNAVVASQTVEVSFANLTGSVAYSGLSSPFTASGTISSTGDEITIAANTANVGNYSQTLTVQSTDDSKSAEVTVKMNVVEPFDGLKLTFDFVTHPEGWPAAKASAVAGNYVYTISATDYTFAHSKVGDGIYCGGTSGSSGYLMIAKSNSLGLPAISGYKLVKVEGTLNNSGTPSTKAEITITNGTDEVTGGASQTWDEKGVAKTYNLSGTVANTMYYLNVSGTANLQMITLVLYYEEAEAPTVAAPTISGVTPFLSSTEVTLTQNDADAIYYTTDEAKKGTPDVDTWTVYNSASKPSFSETTTIYAAAIKGSAWSAVAEKTFTKATILTVAEALTIIEDLENKTATTAEYYVSGVVSTVTALTVDGTGEYYISADGTKTSELQVYKGKWVGGANFTSTDQLIEGDDVTIKGKLKKYNSYKELDQNNEVVAYKLKARLAWSEESYEADLSSSNTYPSLTNTNGVSVSYSSSNTDAATINPSTGAISLVAVGSTTIKAAFTGNETYKANEVSYTLNVSNSVLRADISFEENGGSTVTDLTEQSNLPDPLPTITKAGKNFGGWWTTSTFEAGTEAVAGAAVESTDDIVLYAKWLDSYTVTEALTMIDALADNGETGNVYVSGIVCTAPSNLISGGYLTYYISVDGTETNRLQVYKGKNVGNIAFTDKEDVQAADQVIVYGPLKKFKQGENIIPEFNTGNYLYSLSRKASAGLEYAVTVVAKVVGDDDFINPLTNPNSVDVTYESSDEQVAEVASDGTVTIIGEGSATITASFAGNATYKTAEVSYTLTVSATAPVVDTRKIAASPEGGFSSINGDLSGNEISFAAYKGGAQNEPNGNNTAHELRLYKYQATTEYGGYVTISAKTGCTIDQVVITVSGDCNVGWCKDAEALPTKEDTPIAIGTSSAFDTGTGLDASSVSVVNIDEANQFKIKTITVYYTGDAITLQSIAISGEASVLEYNDGDEFIPTGLVVTGHYSDNSDAVIADGITWAFDPATLSEGDESVSVTATVGNISSSAFPVNGLTVSGAAPALTDYYEKVTETAGIVEGTYLIVYEGESVAFDGGLDDSDNDHKLDKASNTIEVDITNDNKIGVTSATEAATFYIDPTAGTIQAASGKYIGVTSNNNGLNTNNNADAYSNAFSIDGDGNAIIAAVFDNSTMTMRYNTASDQKRFRYYKNTNYPAIQLYKLHDEVVKPAAGLAWDPAEDITITVGDAFTARTLLNPNNIDDAEITIASSNPALATVNAGVVSLVADATGTTTITATFAGNASYKPATVSYKIKVNPAHSIYVSPGLNVNFGSVEKNADVEDKVITVTLTEVPNATATIGGDNPEVFSINPASPAALTTSGDITISVASTATAGTYNATLTISDDAGLATSRVVALKLTVTDPAAEETPISTSTQWVAATAADLVDGAEVLITGVKSEVTYAMSASSNNGNNRTADAGSLAEGVFTPGGNTMSFILEATGVNNNFYIKTSNGMYIYNASTSGNSYLKTKDNNEDASWKIELNEGNAVITSVENTNRQLMRFNLNGQSSPLFNCYASNQQPIKLYVPKPAEPEPPVVDYTEVRNGLTEGWYYTMCLDKAVTAVQGGTIWRVLSKAENGTDVILEEAVLPLVAGRPYIFNATASTLQVAYTGNAVGAAVNDEDNNGLVGSFSETKIDQSPNNYIIYNNALYYVNSNNVYVGEHRAYLDMTGVPAYSTQGNAPGRRRVVMNVYNGNQMPTGIEGIEVSEAPRKVMIDGQLFILRDKKMYDASGRLVK